MLKPGGHWINFGPLLYHFNDNRDAPSVELTYEEVRGVILSIGFEILASLTLQLVLITSAGGEISGAFSVH